jgi:hypothetical protein
MQHKFSQLNVQSFKHRVETSAEAFRLVLLLAHKTDFLAFFGTLPGDEGRRVAVREGRWITERGGRCRLWPVAGTPWSRDIDKRGEEDWPGELGFRPQQ